MLPQDQAYILHELYAVKGLEVPLTAPVLIKLIHTLFTHHSAVAISADIWVAHNLAHKCRHRRHILHKLLQYLRLLVQLLKLSGLHEVKIPFIAPVKDAG